MRFQCRHCGIALRNKPCSRTTDAETMRIKRYECTRCSQRADYRVYKAEGILTTNLCEVALIAGQYWSWTFTDRQTQRKPAITGAEARPIIASIRLMEEEVQRFEREIWFNGLQDVFLNASEEIEFAHQRGCDVGTFVTEGKIMLTLEGSGLDSITLVTDLDKKPTDPHPRIMRIRGMSCTEAEGLALLRRACTSFPRIQTPAEALA